MGQRRGQRGLVEVIRTDADEVPVGVVEERGDRIFTEGRVRARCDHEGREEGHADQHDQQGGKKPASAPRPEPPEANGGRSLPFGDEQRRDEEAGEGEEGVEGVEAPGRQEDAPVIPHDDDDRHAPDTVEGGHVGEVRRPTWCIRVGGAREGDRFLVSAPGQ